MKKSELLEISEHPTYMIITDNSFIFNRLVTLVKPSVIVYEGSYGVRLARGSYKEVKLGVAMYGFGEQNALWFLKEALQKGARAIVKLGLGLNFGESMNPVLVQYAYPLYNAFQRGLFPIADFQLLSIMDWQMSSSEIDYSIDSIISYGQPLEPQVERELSEVRKKYDVKVIDVDTAYIYDFLNRWRAKSLSIILPFVWSESASEIGVWFNYEPSSKEETEVLTNVAKLVLDMFVEYQIRQESLKKEKKEKEK